ncbi:MAG: NADPH-dependent FMN reductase [Solirubrobacteraceae bacterium]
MVRILGISGSLRRGSHNASLLRAATDLLPPGVELEIYDGLRDLPPYDADLDTQLPHPAVAQQRVDTGLAQECTGLGVAPISR